MQSQWSKHPEPKTNELTYEPEPWESCTKHDKNKGPDKTKAHDETHIEPKLTKRKKK